MRNYVKSNWPFVLVVLVLLVLLSLSLEEQTNETPNAVAASSIDSTWLGPSLYTDGALKGEERALVMYGEELITNTAHYLGPKGTVAQLTNGMNCQNCHLDAGNRPWGNNYGAVYTTYPKFRDRSGTVESIYKRVADCMQRSLNGVAVDSNSREFKAIYTYIKWLGSGLVKGTKPYGSGIEKLPFLSRAADPEKGKGVYVAQCQSCHGASGQGQLNEAAASYIYPPLWGPNSYNTGAGLYRISNFAGYAKNNMPFNQANHANPKLSNEEAWDVAAFVNSQPRPSKDLSADWPDISKKPFDHPFGPYTDGFTEQQHKYGPFKPIQEKRKQMAEKKPAA